MHVKYVLAPVLFQYLFDACFLAPQRFELKIIQMGIARSVIGTSAYE